MYIGGPHVGEIAVFHPPQGSEEQVCGPTRRMVEYGKAACSQQGPQENTSINYIKRIVAGPNDEIYIHEGHVYLKEPGKSKFVKEHDSYIKACGGERECDFPTPIRIPPGHWFMMGDNRGESDDSRFWGPVPTSWIIGPAVATYWPPDRIGIF
jgi:signal peptidase I